MASVSGVKPAKIPDWNNNKILHRNTLPVRAYFHNYTSEADALSRDVSKSKTHSLSGTWKFKLANSPFEAPEGFEASSFDTSSWSDIAVPGMWQLQGFGRGPQYTNVKYPIHVDPPNVPFFDNETGSYSRKFTVPKEFKEDQIRLRFEGVDSSYHVWINGKEVGYSQGSRNPDEFDVTDFVDLERENTIAVQVYQWCDGTYIEDQDQWWLSGIFRDVFLVAFPKASRIENLHIQTLLDSSYKDAELKVSLETKGTGGINLKLFDADKSPVTSAATTLNSESDRKWTISLRGQNPHKWTAESPYLYHLIISLDSTQYISVRVGFRQVEIKDGLLKVNGKRVVFRGTNRHEHHPKFGRAVPLEFLKHDLLTMKRHNINAIRTSHQLNDPRLLHLADEMGFWMIDEADLECHGFEMVADAMLSKQDRELPFDQRQLLTRSGAAKWTTDNPEWKDAYIDRAEHLVKRDQLHPSVIIWSLGNEAFFGQNFKEMYKHIKEYDDSRPIHYEPDYDAETMDLYSRMYAGIDWISWFGREGSKKKPLILCEFIHAMGNGPGNIKEYIDVFYKYPSVQGGFAWEWANHGLSTKDKVTGDEYYAYGGDFGEKVHDSTFVMDGLLFSNHEPNPGLTEYAKAIEPVQLLHSDGTTATFINRYDFITLDHLHLSWHAVNESGDESAKGELDIPSAVSPGEEFKVDLPKFKSAKSETILHLAFRLKESTISLSKGWTVATAEVIIKSSFTVQTPSSSDKPLKVDTPEHHVLKVTSETSTWTFNTLHGQLTSWKKSGTELISKPPELSINRAQTDNDKPQDGWNWHDRLVHLAQPSTRKVEYTQPSKHSLEVKVHQQIVPPVLSWSIEVVITYTFSSDGTVRAHVQGKPEGLNLPHTLPRIGFILEMPHEFQSVQWWGRGPGESYRDSKHSQLVSLHSAKSIDALWTDYEVPQESSNRTDTRWVKLSNSSTSLLAQFVDGDERKLFDFQATHYRIDDVADSDHPYKLHKKKREEVVLRLDAVHHGLGTGSCGPKTLDQYALHTEDFEFEVLLH
ncbi:hypothetical protein N0V90_003198 [Kalmusia sp. IMI 367209]|nr:hypothetical protein N0V90_003198 [Kalmusia sp. IMI 367209]